MSINPKKLEAAFRRAGRAQGVRTPDHVVEPVERLLVSRQLDLWDTAVDRILPLIPEPTKDELVRDLAKAEVSKFVNQIYRQYSGLTALSKKLKGWYDKGNKTHRKIFLATINNAIGVSVSDLLRDPKAELAVKASVKWSNELIVTLDGDMKKRLLSDFWVSISEGKDALDIAKVLQRSRQVSAYRARLIAQDQTQKVFSTLSQVRQTDIGVEEYDWDTVGDGAVRDSHTELERSSPHRWDTPTSEGFPGEPVLCRCTAAPRLGSAKVPT